MPSEARIAIFCLAFAAAVSAAVSLMAERVPLNPEQLREEATHVVVGQVKAIYRRAVASSRSGEGTIEEHAVVEVEVETVEKGAGIERNDVIYVRCWRIKTPGNRQVTGPAGHVLPRENQRVRAHLVRGTYAQTEQNDNGLAAVYPNGIAVLDQRQ